MTFTDKIYSLDARIKELKILIHRTENAINMKDSERLDLLDQYEQELNAKLDRVHALCQFQSATLQEAIA